MQPCWAQLHCAAPARHPSSSKPPSAGAKLVALLACRCLPHIPPLHQHCTAGPAAALQGTLRPARPGPTRLQVSATHATDASALHSRPRCIQRACTPGTTSAQSQHGLPAGVGHTCNCGIGIVQKASQLQLPQLAALAQQRAHRAICTIGRAMPVMFGSAMRPAAALIGVLCRAQRPCCCNHLHRALSLPLPSRQPHSCPFHLERPPVAAVWLIARLVSCW